MPDPPASWILIAVLFSSQPLSPSLTTLLHRAAYDLFRSDAAETTIDEGLVRGRVANLKRDLLIGTMGGPAFEAEIDTERGHNSVRFLLTRQGIEWVASRQPNSQLN